MRIISSGECLCAFYSEVNHVGKEIAVRRVKVMDIKKVITLALMLLLIILCSVSAVGATTTTIIYLGSENVNYEVGMLIMM